MCTQLGVCQKFKFFLQRRWFVCEAKTRVVVM